MFRLLRGSVAVVLVLGFSSVALVVFVDAMANGKANASLDQNYVEEWAAIYATANQDWPYAIAADVSGNVYVTGSAGGGYCTTIKYDTNGNRLWVSTYFGGAGYDIAVDSWGNVYVAGTINVNYIGRYLTIKYNASGTQIWARTYGGGGYNQDARAIAIGLDSYGNVYVTGGNYSPNPNIDTIKYSPSGSQLWARSYNGPQNGVEWPADMAVDPSGNVYITGVTYGGPDTRDDIVTIKYNTNGAQLWVKQYAGPKLWGWDKPYALALDSSENLYVTGLSATGQGGYSCVTIKYDSAGTESWVVYYAGTNPYNQAWGRDIAVDSTGNVYVAGQSYESEYSDFCGLIIKYDTNGNELWFVLNESEVYMSMASDSSGKVYIAGSKFGDILTEGYDTSGNQLWSFMYGQPWSYSNSGKVIALDPARNVYVAGELILDFTQGSDIVVIKYASPNEPPVADAGADPTVTDNTLPLGTEQVTLNGSGSTDPDGASDIASYIWAENNVQIASGVLPTVSLSVGMHTIVLTVTDQAGESSTDIVVITVNPTNVPAMVQNIADDVARVDTENKAGLTGLLDAASNAYAGKKYNAAINMMKAFINLCNADSLLSDTDRNRLIAKANNVIAIIQALHL